MANLIIGHRGVKGHYPENTQVSVQAAIDMGLQWVEVDIQPTLDGELVVCHDHTVNRCSNGRGRVDAHTLVQLQQLDFGAWFAPTFAGEPIMTLATLLNLAQQHHLHLNLEIKVDQQNVTEVVTRLKQQLDLSGLPTDQFVLSSFSHDMIRSLHQHCSGYRLGVLSERLRHSDRALLKEVNAFSCHLNQRWIRQAHIDELKLAGYQVWCYTVNQPQKFKYLNQVDAVFSDFPERFSVQ
ncbi:glycerophosphoryl diester phosphodiesterase [Vibrio sp. SM6]|uniref:Glycerophosphoryl diester phosphodiesterase n=1 Tax=Vibrio agarilyticus TaxID=2726741 RepID=A0A7X8YG02_9VIBR|nr:glycerophosphodiester phosphodiesterase family protein [Vibrio agarilyticus]NLS12070.1 glycerophosphoryl diester phosphodiesterase [Vibrio agarilyticus]